MAKTILLVDDDTLMRRSLALILEQAGYRTSTAANAEDALALARRDPPDLVILDIGLPGMDGLDALRWFKQGEMKKLAEYCRKDVEITRDLFLFGFRQQHLLFQNKAGQEVRLPVDFSRAIGEIVRRRAQTIRARQDLYAPNR